jgi:hypothetical protein
MSQHKPTARCFTDRHQRCWRVDLLPRTIREVKKHTGLSLSALAHHPAELIELLTETPFKFVSVMAFICLVQAEEEGITPEQFLDGFDTDTATYTAAGVALLAAIADQWPRSILGLGAPSILREHAKTLAGG